MSSAHLSIWLFVCLRALPACLPGLVLQLAVLLGNHRGPFAPHNLRPMNQSALFLRFSQTNSFKLRKGGQNFFSSDRVRRLREAEAAAKSQIILSRLIEFLDKERRKEEVITQLLALFASERKKRSMISFLFILQRLLLLFIL